MLNEVIVGGIRVHCLRRAEWAEHISRNVIASRNTQDRKPIIGMSLNGQVLAECFLDDDLRSLVVAGDYRDADGQSLVLASKVFCKNVIPERACTTDLFHDIAHVAEQQGLRFYFLGGTASRLDRAVSEIHKLYPNLNIAGYHHGFFADSEEDAILNEIRAVKPDILWVGLGFPKQELFVIKNREKLSGVGWIKTCGGLFDYFSPEIKRAPVWMQNASLEWLFRMIQSPRRYFLRYLITNPVALWLLLTQTRDI